MQKLKLGTVHIALPSSIMASISDEFALFDMRLHLYRHLQRLSPRFYARTPLGDVVSRINGSQKARASRDEV